MKTATLRDLRNNFSKLESWLAEGETVEIQRRGQPVAVLQSPGEARSKKPVKMPDFEARLKRIWGDRIFTEEDLAQIKAYELEGQQG